MRTKINTKMNIKINMKINMKINVKLKIICTHRGNRIVWGAHRGFRRNRTSHCERTLSKGNRKSKERRRGTRREAFR